MKTVSHYADHATYPITTRTYQVLFKRQMKEVIIEKKIQDNLTFEVGPRSFMFFNSSIHTHFPQCHIDPM